MYVCVCVYVCVCMHVHIIYIYIHTICKRMYKYINLSRLY